MSFNPLNGLGPQKPASEKQKRASQAKKSEISAQLRISYLRDSLLSQSLLFLIENDKFLERSNF